MPHTDPAPAGPDRDPARMDAGRIEAALTAPGAPFAVVRVEDGVHAGSLVYADGPRTLREFVETAWAFGDRPFLISGERSYSYAEFFAAVVRLRDGATATPEELRAHVGRRLAAFKVPAHVLVREEPLPRNPTGKILKRELRGTVEAEVRGG